MKGTGTEFGYSYYSSLIECPQRWGFHYQLGLRPVERRPALDVGTATHALLASYYTGILRRQSGDEVARAYGVSEEETAAVLAECHRESVETAERVVAAYVARQNRGRSPEGKIIAVEYPLRVRLGRGCVVTGRVDLVLQSLNGNGVVLVDHKTTSRLDGGMSLLDGQMLTYILLWNRSAEAWGLLPVIEWRWNRMTKGLLPEFDGVEAPVNLGRAERLVDTYIFLSKLKRRLAKIDPWSLPRTYTSCMTRYGACDYYDLCMSGKAALALYVKKEEENGTIAKTVQHRSA